MTILVDDAVRERLEAAAFRRLTLHLRQRTDVQNIDLMNLAGFCRNCLANWTADAAKEKDLVRRVQLILAQGDEGAQFVWRSLRDLFSYSALLLEDIAGGTPKPLDDALAMAGEIADRSPDAVRGAKALINRLFTQQAAEQFAEERRIIGGLIGKPNQVEAVMANFEKRKTAFADPS